VKLKILAIPRQGCGSELPRSVQPAAQTDALRALKPSAVHGKPKYRPRRRRYNLAFTGELSVHIRHKLHQRLKARNIYKGESKEP